MTGENVQGQGHNLIKTSFPRFEGSFRENLSMIGRKAYRKQRIPNDPTSK
jgi:hypothetical protein